LNKQDFLNKFAIIRHTIFSAQKKIHNGIEFVEKRYYPENKTKDGAFLSEYEFAVGLMHFLPSDSFLRNAVL